MARPEHGQRVVVVVVHSDEPHHRLLAHVAAAADNPNSPSRLSLSISAPGHVPAAIASRRTLSTSARPSPGTTPGGTSRPPRRPQRTSALLVITAPLLSSR